MSSQKVKVEINGMNFYVVGGEGDKVKSLASDLDSRIKNIQRSNYRLNQVQTLILTALNILEEKDKESSRIDDIKASDDINLENLKEVERLRDEFDKVQSDNIKLKEKYDKRLKDYNIVSSEKIKLEEDIKNSRLEIHELKKELEKAKNEKNALEEQIFESQKRIIDLSREIESLNDK